MKIGFVLALAASTAAAETKDYQLLIGADFDVQRQGALERVVGVDRDAFCWTTVWAIKTRS
ncbi:MAG TPA: hypothetical protein VGL42_10215 [Opitutaceae bacterium]